MSSETESATIMSLLYNAGSDRLCQVASFPSTHVAITRESSSLSALQCIWELQQPLEPFYNSIVSVDQRSYGH